MKSAALSYRPIQENESKRLAMDLVRDPKNFERHLERYAASVVMTVAYGRRVDDMNDPAVQMVLEMMQYMASLNVPGRFLAESFPILAKFPDFLSPWKREVKQHAAYYGTIPLFITDVRKILLHFGHACKDSLRQWNSSQLLRETTLGST